MVFTQDTDGNQPKSHPHVHVVLILTGHMRFTVQSVVTHT